MGIRWQSCSKPVVVKYVQCLFWMAQVHMTPLVQLVIERFVGTLSCEGGGEWLCADPALFYDDCSESRFTADRVPVVKLQTTVVFINATLEDDFTPKCDSGCHWRPDCVRFHVVDVVSRYDYLLLLVIYIFIFFILVSRHDDLLQNEAFRLVEKAMSQYLT